MMKSLFDLKKSAVFDIEGIGPVRFERSRKARRLNITVRASTGVRVAVPGHIPFRKALALVRPRTAWMMRQIKGLEMARLRHETLLEDRPLMPDKLAKEMLNERVRVLAKAHGYAYNRIFIRRQRTRWGSCSAKNNINLNIKLVRLSPELIDYVIIHELVHTRIKNHQKEFWRELERITGDAKGLDRRLNQYRLDLL